MNLLDDGVNQYLRPIAFDPFVMSQSMRQQHRGNKHEDFNSAIASCPTQSLERSHARQMRKSELLEHIPISQRRKALFDGRRLDNREPKPFGETRQRIEAA